MEEKFFIKKEQQPPVENGELKEEDKDKKMIDKLKKENLELQLKNRKLEEEIGELRKEIAELTEKNFNLRYDSLTGLGLRIEYYRTLNKKIEELIEKNKLQLYLEKKDLTEEDIKKLNEIQLHIVHGDIAYLNKYNQDPGITEHYGEYGGGDEILRRTGELIQKVDRKKLTVQCNLDDNLDDNIKAFRTGGDEITFLCEGLTKEKVNKIIAKFIENQSKIEIEGADLPPAINCGSASFVEAIEAYIKTFSVEERKEFSLEKQAKKIQELFTAIAARRAMIAKGVGHLVLLTELLLIEDQKKFKNNIKYLQKSIFGLTKEDIENKLVPFFQPPSLYSNEEKMKEVLKIVKEQLEIKTIKEDIQTWRQRKVVTEIADRILMSDKR